MKFFRTKTAAFLASLALGASALLAVAMLVPAMAFAQATTTYPDSSGATGQTYNGTYCSSTTASFVNLSDLFKYFTCSLERLVLPLLFSIAGLVFVWGAVKFIGARDSAEKEQGQQFMVWGIIGFAVMLSLFGLIKIFRVTFFTSASSFQPVVPTTPSQLQ